MNKETLYKILGPCLWISFLGAGIASILFFATFDPAVLAKHATFPLQMSREAGYTIGFLLFWLLLMLNNAIVLFLVRTKSMG